MMSINNFLLFEQLSSVSEFLKSNYDKIFNDPNQALNNLFVSFTKRVDTDKNISNLYKNFITSNQSTINNEVNKAETIEGVNKILSDEIKYFYFSLTPIINKLQNDEFSIEEIFSKSRDKNLQALMSYPEDKFSNAVSQYVGNLIPTIKKDAGIEEQAQAQEIAPVQSTTERIKHNINRILEAEEVSNVNDDLIAYKKAIVNWLSISLLKPIKNKIQLLNQVGVSTSNIVDQLSNQMKGTNNENAKKMIINKVFNMDKEALKNLGLSLGITEEELGQL